MSHSIWWFLRREKIVWKCAAKLNLVHSLIPSSAWEWGQRILHSSKQITSLVFNQFQVALFPWYRDTMHTTTICKTSSVMMWVLFLFIIMSGDVMWCHWWNCSVLWCMQRACFTHPYLCYVVFAGWRCTNAMIPLVGLNMVCCEHSEASVGMLITIPISCAGLGVCLPLPADAVVMVRTAGLHTAAATHPPQDPASPGGGGRQGAFLCGLHPVDRLLRSERHPRPPDGGKPAYHGKPKPLSWARHIDLDRKWKPLLVIASYLLADHYRCCVRSTIVVVVQRWQESGEYFYATSTHREHRSW